MVVVDDYSRFVWIKILNNKENATALAALQEYKAWAEARQHPHGHRLLAIRCDGGGEFHSQVADQWYTEHGIEVQTTTAHSSQSNGVAERMHRTIMDKVRTVLTGAGMSQASGPRQSGMRHTPLTAAPRPLLAPLPRMRPGPVINRISADCVPLAVSPFATCPRRTAAPNSALGPSDVPWWDTPPTRRPTSCGIPSPTE